MNLVIHAHTLNNEPLPLPITGRFDATGGTIGRLDANTLVLPDEGRLISRVHAEVRFNGGIFTLRNVGSANAIMVGGRPVPPGEAAVLSNGDELVIGRYVMRASVAVPAGALDSPERTVVDAQGGLARSAAAQFVSAPVPEERTVLIPPPASAIDILDQLVPSGPSDAIDVSGARERENPFDEFEMLPPEPVRETVPDPEPDIEHLSPIAKLLAKVNATAPAQPAAAAEPEAAAQPRAKFQAAPAPYEKTVPVSPPKPVAARRGILVQPTDTGRVETTIPLVRVVSSQPAAEKDASVAADDGGEAPAKREPLPMMPMPPIGGAAQATPAPPRPVVHPPVDSASAEVLWQAFCEGADVDPDVPQGLNPDLMRIIGQLLRHSVDGTLKLVASRAAAKKELRAQVTTLQRRNNNPLKFSSDARAAIDRLLQPPTRDFIAGPAALDEVMDDLLGHANGTMAGMHAALTGVLRRFEPEQLEKQLSGYSVLDSLLPMNRRAKLWELYLEHHKRIQQDAEDNFHELYGDAFMKAYAAELERLGKGRERSREIAPAPQAPSSKQS